MNITGNVNGKDTLNQIKGDYRDFEITNNEKANATKYPVGTKFQTPNGIFAVVGYCDTNIKVENVDGKVNHVPGEMVDKLVADGRMPIID